MLAPSFCDDIEIFRISIKTPPSNNSYVMASDFRHISLSIFGLIPSQLYSIRMTLDSDDARASSLQWEHDFEWSAAFEFYAAANVGPSDSQAMNPDKLIAR